MLNRAGAWTLAFLCAFLSAETAWSQLQSSDKLIEKFRSDCIGKLIPQKMRGQNIRPLVGQCVREKLNASWKLPPEIPLFEFSPWITKNVGPENAKGLVYFIAGQRFDIATQNDFRLAPYFVHTLNTQGWDIVGAKFPEEIKYVVSPKVRLFAGAAQAFVQRRLKHFSAMGYRRIVLVGHSWGGWVALLTAANQPKDLNALILVSPSNGRPTFRNGDPNPEFKRNLTEFGPLLERTKVPTVGMFFSGDDEEIPGRAAVFRDVFSRAGIPHFAIENPPGFSGHFAGWLPIFSYAYDRCISLVIENVMPQENCRNSQLSTTDFRSIFSLAQVQNIERLRSDHLLAKKQFVSYRLRDADNVFYDYNFAPKRSFIRTSRRGTEETNFKDSRFCTARECTTLAKWSESELLEFDLGTGAIRAWWIESK